MTKYSIGFDPSSFGNVYEDDRIIAQSGGAGISDGLVRMVDLANQAAPKSAEQPDECPMELLKLLGYVNAMIGYCQSLRVGTVISEGYMQRMSDHYIPNTQEVCLLIAKLLDRASAPEREAVERLDVFEAVCSAVIPNSDMEARYASLVTDKLLERFDIRRRG